MPPVHPITFVLPDGHEVTVPVAEDAFILDAALEAGLSLSYTCLQGWCLTCAGRVDGGTGRCVDDSAALRYFPQDADEGFVLLCTGRPRCACRIVTHQSPAMKAHRRARGLPTPSG